MKCFSWSSTALWLSYHSQTKVQSGLVLEEGRCNYTFQMTEKEIDDSKQIHYNICDNGINKLTIVLE